jgi:predicted alpha-1,6-mannanase (GH76 family)
MLRNYADYATSAMTTLNTQWFNAETPTQWGGGSNFWITPTICEEIVRFMAQTNSQAYVQTMLNALNVGSGYIGNCSYYDDETAWGRFYTTSYFFCENTPGLTTHASAFLAAAQSVLQDLQAGWDDVCGGGIWWMRNPKSYVGNFKATNSTAESMEIALDLYTATEDPKCLAWAQKCWNWISESRLVNGGWVIGGLTVNGAPDPKNGPAISLQGYLLNPLWMLYKATNDTTYIDVALSIVDATLNQMVWPPENAWTSPTAILMSRADSEWIAGGSTFQQAWSGFTPFKGIFIGLFGDLVVNLATMPQSTYQEAAKAYTTLIHANADTVIANFPTGCYGMDWHTPQPAYQPTGDDGIDASLQYCALSLFNAAAKLTLTN